MIELQQFSYGSDNLGYLLYGAKQACAVDAGDPAFILDFCGRHGLDLEGITNTHGHSDHTCGNRKLARLSGAPLLAARTLIHTGSLELEGERIEVIHTPGHSDDSLCLLFGSNLIAGDTLFIANVGNCPSKRVNAFKESLDRLLALPGETRVYPGHDYTARSIRRALGIEKGNPFIRRFQDAYNPPPVVSTIGDERRINPYLRAAEPEVAAHLREHGKDTSSSLACFRSFLELY